MELTIGIGARRQSSTATRKRQRGFTLVELMVVVAIIGIIASIATVKTGQSIAHARFARVEADMNVMRMAAMQYYYDTNNTWAPDQFPSVAPAFVPTYMRQWPTPPCPGWNYDWDNLEATGLSVRVTMRDGGDSSHIGTPANAVYYICIDPNSSPDCSSATIGGIDIFQAPDHIITCKE